MLNTRTSTIDFVEFALLYPTTPNKYFMEKYNKTKATILYHARNRGLKKSDEYISNIRREEHEGKPRSQETKDKISQKLSGIPQGPERARKSLITRRQRGTMYAGKRHAWWTGGTTRTRFDDPRYIVWRTSVMERDDYCCRECGKEGDRKKKSGLDAHHRKSWKEYPDLRFDVANGVALCRSCHIQEHKRRKGLAGYWC